MIMFWYTVLKIQSQTWNKYIFLSDVEVNNTEMQSKNIRADSKFDFFQK